MFQLEENETKQFLHTYYAAHAEEEFNMESVARKLFQQATSNVNGKSVIPEIIMLIISDFI